MILQKAYFLFFLSLYPFLLFAEGVLQDGDEIHLVDPFIGTDNAKTYTKWGKEGGTYPGAVAPWGYVQLSPETVGNGQPGYHYRDSVMQYFSCIGHKSGFPEGSSGNLKLMPLDRSGKHIRPFQHEKEQATPGYYQVTFPDDGTLLECTANTRVGIFQITFPKGVEPKLWIADVGTLSPGVNNSVYGSRYGSVFKFNMNIIRQETANDGYILHFAKNRGSSTVLTVMVSASGLGNTSALKNMTALEQEASQEHMEQFAYVYRQTKKAWSEVLQAIAVEDSDMANKRSFYTALYHACLLPWVVSDVDGWYKGADGAPHQVSNRLQYGGFSPWDTFRSLHPLIELLWPQRQAEMAQSMLTVYEQTGFLPTESMTGNHAVPILVDTYMKDPKALPAEEVYRALKGSIYHPPFKQEDLPVYHERGFVPATMGESVTRTMEYAYDDWALSYFANAVIHDPAVADAAAKYSHAYRHLFNEEELFFIPKGEQGWKKQPSTVGYKEGDAYIYSYFIPQYPRDLINLMGGDTLFVSRLQRFLQDQQLVFDNEPAFHVPYLFSYAQRPDLTQFWVHDILTARFSDTPEGLSGNDDLGSMSSWYVFNALGFFPMTPGKPFYTLGTPLFDRTTIRLTNGKTLTIQKTAEQQAAYYVQDVRFNDKAYPYVEISHQELSEGGLLSFIVGKDPLSDWNMAAKSLGEMTEKPAIQVDRVVIQKNRVHPDEHIAVKVRLHNTGAEGTRQLAVMVDGKIYTYKNVWLKKGESRTDSIPLRLYPYGKHLVDIGGQQWTMEVIPDPLAGIKEPHVDQLRFSPLLKLGSTQTLQYRIINLDGQSRSISLPVYLNGQVIGVDSLTLAAGEAQERSHAFPVDRKGKNIMTIGDQHVLYQVYQEPEEAQVFGGWTWHVQSRDTLVDHTPFSNRALLQGNAFSAKDQLFTLDSQRYVVWNTSPVLNALHTRMTMMLWLKPKKVSSGLVDVLSKGDQHVLQIVGGRKINFFAGGWGRGECAADLPADWYDTWHHVAGVCDGRNLFVYIDGKLSASMAVEPDVLLANSSNWQLGQNEEFPGERIYQGAAKGVMVFAESLSATEIADMMEKSQ